jgi:hypothetical protein
MWNPINTCFRRRNSKRLCLLFAFAFSVYAGKAQVYINEFQASNIDTKLDNTGNYHEWVELYNAGSSTIDLKGYFLSNDLSNPYQHEIRGTYTVGPHRHAMIWIDKDLYDACCIFRLHMEGGTIGLFSPAGVLLDSVSFPRQYLNASFGRYPDGADHWSYFWPPTPWKSNEKPGFDDPGPQEDVLFSLEGGIYQGEQVLELHSLSGTGTIRYTQDGSWPTESSTRYTGPILLTSTSVIRACIYQEGSLPGPTLTRTYILNDSSSIPVVSIVTDSRHFFDNEYGFYVTGTNGILGKCATKPANFYQDWERPANIEYFTTDGAQVINQMVGLRMIGGCSRKLPNKSIAVFARKKYGDNSLSYRFFNTKKVESFKALVLRNSSDDASKSMLRDGFMQSTVAPYLDLDVQGYQPASVFINGEYWGILNVREKVNEHYPASNFQMDSDLVDVLERKYYTRPIAGSGEHFIDLLNFVKANSLSNTANYDYVKTQMDVNEFMNYWLSQVYFANEDWPHNNIKYWRPHVEGGKWRWIVFDTDFGWGLYPRSGNTLVASTTAEGDYSVLINALLENDEFRNEFVQRMASLINTAFHPDTVTVLYDSLLAQLDREIGRHYDRWSYLDEETYLYQTREKIPTFTREHPALVRSQFMDYFDIPGMYELSLGIDEPGKGHVLVSGLNVTDGFSGAYFSGIPLGLEAVPASGYTFSHWEGTDPSGQRRISLTSSVNTSLRAVFVTDTLLRNIRINEVCAKNLTGIEDDYGQREDWLEFYNGNDADVDLAGLYLSDSRDLGSLYRIPYGEPKKTTVGAGEYLIIWCDGDTLQGPAHSNFKLRREGEVISLVQQIDQELHVLDSVAYPPLESDLCYGILEDGEGKGYMNPTPLARNSVGPVKKLYINEFLTRNCGVAVDESGEADDWIEIYNPGPDTLDLGGLYLTDSFPDPLKHRIPPGSPGTKVPPFGHMVLWADGQADQGARHLSFKLAGRNEQIGIYQLGAGYIDSVEYWLDYSGLVLGRMEDGAAGFQPVTPTPGAANQVRITENLYINEFMANNSSTPLDTTEEYVDWIEIYNANEFPVDLGGLFITDSLDHPVKYQIPRCESGLTTIPAGGFLVLRADNQQEKGALHLDFKLDRGGEEIGLFCEDGKTVIDSLSYARVARDMAIGRLEDGGSHLQIVRASPGSSNSMTLTKNLYVSEFSASGNTSYGDASGAYDDWIEIYNDNDYDVNIGGMYLTDSMESLTRYYIPRTCPDSTTIGAKDFLILWADNQCEEGIRHLGFRLRGEGEQVALVDMDGLSIIDSVSFPNQYSNFTYSRLQSTGAWRNMRPTPWALNVNKPLSGISINEFMASNASIPDDFGEFDDWIELYNANDHPVDVGGLYLTDTIGEPAKFRIPSKAPKQTTIAAKGFLVLYADDQREQGNLHTNFKLSSEGEAILLYHYDESTLIDSVSYNEQYRNTAFGRIGESKEWCCVRPTPGAENVFTDYTGLVINEIMGYNKTTHCDEYNEYEDWIELYNTTDTPIDIGGLFITDSLQDPECFRMSSVCPDSTTVEAGGYILLWADKSEEQGILHLGFKISKTGEAIGIFDPGGNLIDSVSYPFISPNTSFGRMTDGADTWAIFRDPTPLSANVYTTNVLAMKPGSGLNIYPNPVGEVAVLELSLDAPASLIIEIIDSKGMLCSQFEEVHDGRGKQTFRWTAEHSSGNMLENGLYICRVRTADSIFSLKFLVAGH